MDFTFISKYKKDTSALISVEEFKAKYLFGLPLQRYGKAMPDEVFESQIQIAQEKIEELLQIKLIKQIYTEDKPFYSDDWKSWGFVPTQYPVVCPLAITGRIGPKISSFIIGSSKSIFCKRVGRIILSDAFCSPPK